MTKAFPHVIINTEREGNNMKEKVFEAIKKSGKYGIRLRDIGHYCNCWHVMCLDYVHELIDEGKVEGKTIGAGWQAYIKYYAKEK